MVTIADQRLEFTGPGTNIPKPRLLPRRVHNRPTTLRSSSYHTTPRSSSIPRVGYACMLTRSWILEWALVE